MTTKTVGPCPELEQLTREGEQLLNDEIHVTFTEEDRQNAKAYDDINACIICTALNRMGYKNVTTGGEFTIVDGERFDLESVTMNPNNLGNPVLHQMCSKCQSDGCFYEPSIVGQTLILRRAKS